MEWRRYLRFWGPDARTDANDEIAFHLDLRVRDLVRSGLDDQSARARAAREFGDARAIRDEVVVIDERRFRRTQRSERVRNWLADIHVAARSLRRTPGFAAIAISCIALGVGASTAIFSAVNAVLLRPLPYRDTDELVSIYGRLKARGITGSNISYPDYLSWRDQDRSFSAVGMWTWRTYTLSGDTDAERIEGAAVTPSLFPALGIHPVIGRHFDESEATIGGQRAIMLSHALWRRRFGGDTSVVGRTITVEGGSRTVVGVMPPNFAFPDKGLAWTPFIPAATEARGNRTYAGAIARLRTGVTRQAAERDLENLSARLAKEFPGDNFGWDAEVLSLRDDLVGDMRRPLAVFLGAVGLLLLIACSNVANLMLARGAARRREIAVRVALGAGRRRVLHHVFAESLTLAALGCAFGIAIAFAGIRLIAQAFPDGAPFYITLGIDVTALAFAVAASLSTALIFGIVPALDALRVDAQQALRDGGRSSGDSRSRVRLRSGLVVAQVALSAMLLIGATLLARSYQSLAGTDLGFHPSGIISARLSLTSQYGEPARRQAFFDQVLTRFAAIPGVIRVGSAQGIPFSGWNMESDMTIEGRPAPARGSEVVPHYQFVSGGYLDAIGAPIVRGRALTDADRDSVAPVAVINDIFAERHFAGEDPIGKRVRFGDANSTERWITIVGVARAFRHYQLANPMGPAIYLSLMATPTYSQTFVLRTTAPDPAALVPAMRSVVADIDRNIPLYQVRTFDEAVARALWRQRFQMQVLGTFAVVALLLASIGIYGLVSWTVTQRTREVGLRRALGARSANVVALIAGQGARLAIAGVAIGILGALALSRVLGTMLYGIAQRDVVSYVAVGAVLLSVGIVASIVPALRAARVDPSIAIKLE